MPNAFGMRVLMSGSKGAMAETTDLLKTPLHDAHAALGAKIVPFAGYAMPVQYPDGIMAEHNWTRASAGLFDVSHMGQAAVVADDGRHETVARGLEALCPADILGLGHGRQRYTQLVNDDGGTIDDLMIARSTDPADDGTLMLVVNAARKAIDYAHIAKRLPDGVALTPIENRALIAIQGPKAGEVIAEHVPDAGGMRFMDARSGAFDGIDLHLSRSGYTGEDGFELSVPRAHARTVWDTLLADDRVKPVGLGARDTLRLEAGLCLYGHELDETISPIEAGLLWSIGKRRREEGGFPGADRLLAEIANGPARRRVGIRPEGRAPARDGAEIQSADGTVIGIVKSGGYGPTVGAPIAMGYVSADYASPETEINLIVRGKPIPARVVKLPFVSPRFAR